MATTTTHYGFDIPQSTDLVKDGATAIATLGQDIDTAMNTALGTKKSGLVLLNTTSFSGVSSVSLPANTFTATYEHYRIILNMPSVGTSGLITIRMRAAGVDNSSSNYRWRGNEQGSSNTTYNGYNDSGVQTSFRLAYGEATYTNNSVIDFLNPNLSNNTSFFATTVRYDGTNTNMEFSSGSTTVTTSYDSLTINFSGSQTGSYSVYGYNK